MDGIRSAVLRIDLPETSSTRNLAAGLIITTSDVDRMDLDNVCGVTFLKIVTKGATVTWLVPLDKVNCLERIVNW